MSEAKPATVHPSADVSDRAVLGTGTRVWNRAQIREGARLGKDCIVGKDAYIDNDVVIGHRCKIQNAAQLYHGLTLEDGVFIGPAVVFTNDKLPRAINPDGSLKSGSDWEVGKTTVCEGASIGAGAIVLPGVRIGRFALVGAGALVTRDVPDFALVFGAPARLVSWVCRCARSVTGSGDVLHCSHCNRHYRRDAEALVEVPDPALTPKKVGA